MNYLISNCIILFLTFLILPALAAFVISKIIDRTSSRLISICGEKFFIVIASLGIITHELSHIMMAIIFGHKIDGFQLIQLPKEGQLGYVKHSSDPRNIWQAFGNPLIGFAPMIGNGFAIYFLTKWLNPEILNGIFVWQWRLVFWLILTFSLSLGLNLSFADFQNSLHGSIPALAILMIAGVLTSLWKINLQVFFINIIHQEIVVVLIGILLAVISYLISKILSIF